MAWWHRKGQRVVCVDDQWSGYGAQLRAGIQCPLAKGTIYTVCQVTNEGGWYGNRQYVKPCLVLLELDHPAGPQHGFAAARFRPVHHCDTSKAVEELKRLTLNPPAKVKEGA